MNCDICEFDFGRYVFTTSTDGLASTPFVKYVVGEIEFKTGAVLLCYGTDENTIAIEELEIDGVGVRIVGVVEEEGVERWGASLVLLVDSGVDVVN